MRHVILILLCFVLLAACTPEEPTGEVTPGPEGDPTTTPVEHTPVPMDPEAEQTATSAAGPAEEGAYPPPLSNQPAGYPEPSDNSEGEGDPGPSGEPDSESPVQANCEIAIDPQFLPLLEANSEVAEQVQCPVEESEPRQAAYQPFEHGEMYWLSNEAIILVLRDGKVSTHEDVFEEGMREVPEGAPKPPSAELVQPKRGFGHVWINMVDEIGFGLVEERGYTATLQYFQNDSILLTSADGRILVLNGTEGEGSYKVWQLQDGEWSQG